MQYTKEELDKMREMVERGCSRQEIADALGRGVGAVTQQIRRIGACDSERKPWSEEELEALSKMRAEGMSAIEIGKVLGRTGDAVANKVRNMHIAVGQRKSDAYRFVEANANVMSMEEMADALGCDTGKIWRILGQIAES